MNLKFNANDYLNRECVIFPCDTYRKTGYIKNIDDLGITYEVTKGREEDKGVYFCNHSSNFSVKFI